MPLYEFKCDSCNKTQELFYNMNDEKTPPTCCGNHAKRLYTSGVIGAEFTSGTTINEAGKRVKFHGDHFCGELGVHLKDKKHLERVMKEQGVGIVPT